MSNDDSSNSMITITFALPKTAFGFNYGATDDPWTLSAYHASSKEALVAHAWRKLTSAAFAPVPALPSVAPASPRPRISVQPRPDRQHP